MVIWRGGFSTSGSYSVRPIPMARVHLSPGHGPALEEPPRKNIKQEKTTEPTKRLSVDVPVSVHRRFKTACSATNRQMVAELRHLIEAHILELESEIGSGGQDDLR